MEQRRNRGQSAEDGGEARAKAENPKRTRRPVNARKVKLEAYRLKFCRLLVDHKVAEAMPHIADKFAAEAIKGSIEYARALAQMATIETVDGPPPRGGRRPKTLAEILLAEFKKPRKTKVGDAGAESAPERVG